MLRTPGRAEDSFSDDPLRILRAARFAAKLGFEVAEIVFERTQNRGALFGEAITRLQESCIHSFGVDHRCPPPAAWGLLAHPDDRNVV